ncbi:hypothetical protein Q7C36_004143 [Tachysurus vachellii]|uniref:Uncharacterized protein n=1 Tax=Tachysurus vachellii TaxID=175792 RepID=A0AA88NNU6_TACVA|nr:hypothetical protein Q7C36_004143 [Tachysurus vachellii]
MAASSPGASSAALHVSPSEEGELMDASEPVGASQPVLYEELLEVVTRAVAKLDLDWPVEQQKQRAPSKLAERFLRPVSLPERQSLPFFPDLHAKICRTMSSLGEEVRDAVLAVLPGLPEDKLSSLLNTLASIGVESKSDVQFIKEEDLPDYITPIQCRRAAVKIIIIQPKTRLEHADMRRFYTPDDLDLTLTS